MVAVYLGLFAVWAYGAIIGVLNLISLFKYGKEQWWRVGGFVAYLLFVPALLHFAYPMIDPYDPSVWPVAFLLFLVFLWAVLGFFIKSTYLRIATGETFWREQASAKKRTIIGSIIIVVGAVVYALGFNGVFSEWAQWIENALVVVSLYLPFQGIMLVTRNWKYALGKGPEAVKTASEKRYSKRQARKSNKK